MFLEVYAVPLHDYSKDTRVAIKPENRRLIEMTGARIRYSMRFKDRAEIVLPSKETFVTVGSYDELIQRMADSGTVIARA